MNNKKILILSPFFMGCFYTAFCSLSFKTTEKPINKKTEKKEITRSWPGYVTDSATKNNLNFNKTVFTQNPSPTFFMGAKEITDNTKNYSVTRVRLGLEITEPFGITPEKIRVGQPEEDNPLYGTIINNLALFNNTYPIATKEKTTGDPQNIYFILNPQVDGSIVITSNDIYDAGEATSQEIKALAGSNLYVFAAASATGKSWQDQSADGVNRGIAILKPNLNTSPQTLKQIDADDFSISSNSTPVKAAKIDLETSAGLVSFVDPYALNQITTATIGANVDMFWDEPLQRLYIALSDVKRDDNNREGGCISVLVGRATKDSEGKDSHFDFSPIVYDLNKNKFTLNSDRFIIGFYYDGTSVNGGNNDIASTANKVRIMHTSTGKNYLIINSKIIQNTLITGGTITSNGYDEIFALPLLPDQQSNIPAEKVGTLSKLDNSTKLPTFDSEPTNAGEMPQADQDAVLVGKNNIQDTEELTDMFVYGDSIFICLGSTTKTQNDGIFQSTAIFNENGVIVGWTQWQRVMGDIQRVFGGNVDNLSNFYFLASQSNDPTTDEFKNTSNTVRITNWGKTEQVNEKSDFTPDTDKNLSSLLSQIFPQNQGGVFQIINFDEQTDGFFKGHFSMMVAIGYEKIALIQTGKWENGRFIPIRHFELNNNVFVFDDQALKEIAPLCFAEVSRVIEPTTLNSIKGWLFIGGYNGVVVLSDNNGNGWDTTNGLLNLDAANYPYPPTTWTFKNLSPSNNGDFSSIRKIVCRGGYLWILTMKDFYRVEMNNDKFSTNPAVLAEDKINLGIAENILFSDFLIAADNTTGRGTFIFGTTSGIYYNEVQFIANKDNGFRTTQIGPTIDPALHLHYLSKTKGNPVKPGNLYALHANFLTNSGKINRYYVNGRDVKQIDQFLDLHNFRGNFVTDGAFGFSELSKNSIDPSFVNIYPITSTASDTFSTLDSHLDLDDLNWHVGVITRNTASGSWLVPGDWGVRVNE